MSRDSSRTARFLGEFRHGVDPKNRITIPAAWRSGDGQEFYARLDSTGSCIIVMPPEAYEAILEKIEAMPGASPRERQVFIRQLSSASQSCSADKQGRMVLPPEFCSAIGLNASEGREVILVGASGRFEIWNPQRWEATRAVELPTYLNLANQLGL